MQAVWKAMRKLISARVSALSIGSLEGSWYALKDCGTDAGVDTLQRLRVCLRCGAVNSMVHFWVARGDNVEKKALAKFLLFHCRTVVYERLSKGIQMAIESGRIPIASSMQ